MFGCCDDAADKIDRLKKIIKKLKQQLKDKKNKS